jgi:ATP-dependent RNA helicase DeaD
MALTEYASVLAPELLAAIERKGYSELTAVQLAVLDETLSGRDLRITSQTGSGKTIAIGLILRSVAFQPASVSSGIARPRALVIAPTRELAHQVEQELSWLYAESGGRLATTTGGASYRDELRALAKGPSVVVGTPGRLLDHLKRGSIDTSEVAAVVLDEADRMLELGFREELEAIFKTLPETRLTHLVSATFPRMVRSLADSVQNKPAHVEGTRLGAANVDIDHVIHIVEPRERLAAIINLLLANPDDQTLVFVRTRADAAHLANELVVSGFAASGLSGEMEQAARSRTLAAFRQGGLRALIATDVAARGIDVQDVARVIHAELPTNADAYTHRSGRTGRAGRRGTSSLLVAPAAVVHATRLLRGLGIQHRFEAIPSAEQIKRAADERTLAELTAESAEASADEQRWQPLAERLVLVGSIERTLSRLLARTQRSTAQPREVRSYTERPVRKPGRYEGNGARDDRSGRPSRYEGNAARGPSRYARDEGDATGRAPRQEASTARDDRAAGPQRHEGRGHDARPAPRRDGAAARSFTPFRVSWGQLKGADARRLLAVVCRRGEIRGRDVGAIRVEPTYAIVDVASEVAEGFARAAALPDPREPNVTIRRDGNAAASGAPRTEIPGKFTARSETPAKSAARTETPGKFAPRTPKRPRSGPGKPFKKRARKD